MREAGCRCRGLPDTAMKSSIPIKCPNGNCAKEFPQDFRGSSLPEYAQCPYCGAQIYLYSPLGDIAARLLMLRAQQELADEDVTVSILLSVIAVERHMSFLFFKWRGIDSGKLLHERTQEDLSNLEKDWSDMRSIGKRLDELSRLLTDSVFDEFACENRQQLVPHLAGFCPSTSFKKFFQENLFDTRNRIVHYGEIDFEKPDGER